MWLRLFVYRHWWTEPMLWIPLMVKHQLAETLCLCTEPLAKSQRGDLNPPSSPDYCSRWLYHLSYAGMFAVELQRVIQPHDKRDFFSILVRVDSRPARGTAFCFPLHLPSGWVLDASRPNLRYARLQNSRIIVASCAAVRACSKTYTPAAVCQ